MPEPEITENYIRIRVKNPNLFEQDSFRTIDISTREKIKAIIGRLKGETTTTVQSYLFDRDVWTVERAQAWVREHRSYAGVPADWLNENMKINKTGKAKITNINSENKVVSAIVSTEQKDRDNEIILTSAWKENLKHYLKHPVLLTSHNYSKLTNQIGEAIAVNITPEGLKMDFKYYAGEGNPEADWAWVLASKNMAMFSVGFKAIEWLEGDDIPEKFKAENPSRVYTNAELLEVSQVLIGSNRGALQLSVENPTREQAQYMYEVVKAFGGNIPEIRDGRYDYSLKTETKSNQKQETKSVIPFHSYELQPETAEWDGPEVIRNAEIEDLKIICAWYDSENPDIKNSYKLPHHILDGYKTNWNGVRSAMGALLGARGGVDIPDRDRRGVYNHLAKHYQEFGKEAPEFKEYEQDIKISDNDLLLPIKLSVKSIEDAETIIGIIKSGRVLSEKNRKIITDTKLALENAISLLNSLLEATQVNDEPQKNNDIEKLRSEIKSIVEKYKSKGG